MNADVVVHAVGCIACRLKAEVANRDAELQRLHEQLEEYAGVRQQIEVLEFEHGKQLEELHREMADISEYSETTNHQLECEKNALEAELTKALQDLVAVNIISVLFLYTRSND